MAKKSLEDINYEDDLSDKIEPYVSALGLGADAIGLGTALTGVGAPIGAAIAGIGNIPNLIVDSYQTVRDWNRVYNNKGSIKDALWNTGELTLGLFGAKYAAKGAKAINDRRVLKEIQYRYEQELVKRNKRNWTFLKSKMSDEELAEYILQKSLNAAANSKHVYDAKKKAKDNNRRLGRVITYSSSIPINAYHVIQPLQNDNTRNYNHRILKEF